MIERDQVATLIIHGLLGVVASDGERIVRSGITLGARNLGLQDLLGDLALHTVLVTPTLGGEVVQIVLHILIVLVGHVVRDMGVGILVGAETVGRRRHHHRHDNWDSRGGGQSRPSHTIHVRTGRPLALGVNAGERRGGLADLIPGVLENRRHVGDPLEGVRLGSTRRDGHIARLGLLLLTALPGVVLPDPLDHHLPSVRALLFGAGPVDGQVAIRVHLLEVDDEHSAGGVVNLPETADGLLVLRLTKGVLLESERNRSGCHFYFFLFFN